MSPLYPEGDTDRPTPITALKSQRSAAAQQLKSGKWPGETEMGQNRIRIKWFSDISGNN